MLTNPKRLRAYFLHDRSRLGLLSRVASRTLQAHVGAALGESDAVRGVVSLSQTFGSLAHWHPYRNAVVSEGAFRRDGSFVGVPAHDPAVLAEAWRRALLALLVREDWLEADTAAAMFDWPHSGFSAYVETCVRGGGPRGRATRGALRSARPGGGVAVALRRRARRGGAQVGRERGPVGGRAPLCRNRVPGATGGSQPGEGRGEGALLRRVRQPAARRGSASFRFEVRQTSDGRVRSGLRFENRATRTILRIQKFTSFMIVDRTALMVGSGTLDGLPGSFTVVVMDQRESGRNDRFSIAISGGPTVEGLRQSVNIRSHEKKCGHRNGDDDQDDQDDQDDEADDGDHGDGGDQADPHQGGHR